MMGVYSKLQFLFEKRSARTNLKRLFLFIGVLVSVMFLFTALFQVISHMEGQDHSWISGFYWTLVTMSTLGFGDIVFYSDVGRLFSALVLVTGVVFLLVLLPFTFIQFFYAPWLETQAEARAPRELPETTKDHIIITAYNNVAISLIQKLDAFDYEYWLLIGDLSQALEISDMGYNVVYGSPDDIDTWYKVRVEQAALVVANGNERVNTNVAFTVRELSETVPVVSFTGMEEASDILKLAGSDLVLNLSEMMGQALVRRVVSGSARVHVIGRFQELVIAEAPAVETPLVNKTLAETRLREITGVNVVGLWERGGFKMAKSNTLITDSSILVMTGTIECLRNYDELMGIYHATDAPVVVIGGGRVGQVVARALKERRITYKIIEKTPDDQLPSEYQVQGDAASLEVLRKAGIDEAHTVVITPNDDDTNIYLTLYCRRLRPDIQIISRATLDRNLQTLHRAGADFTLSYATMGANAIFNYMQRGELVMLAEGLNIFKVPVPPKMQNKRIRELNLRDETGLTIVGVEQDQDRHLQPDPDFKLLKKQKLILIGTLASEKKFWNCYNKGLPVEGRRRFQMHPKRKRPASNRASDEQCGCD